MSIYTFQYSLAAALPPSIFLSHPPQPFFCLSLFPSPNMDQALRGQHWSIEDERRGVWMWSTKCTPILSTFEFKRTQKKEKKNKIISPNLFERNDKIYCCRPLGDLFSSVRRVKCVLAFFFLSFFFLCCYLNAWTENDTLPTTVLKRTCSNNMRYVVINSAHTGTFARLYMH